MILAGAVAHLGERLVCNQEVAGSNPVGSIHKKVCKNNFAVLMR